MVSRISTLALVASLTASATATCAINSAATSLIQSYETFQPKPYNDGYGYWTIGYGHRCVPNEPSCPDVKWPITEAQAQTLFQTDIATYENCLASALTVCLNDNQYGALTSWTYNIGCPAMQGSTLIKDMNAGQDPDTVASQQLPQWDKAGGKVSSGLQKRRAAELNLFKEASSGTGNCCNGGGTTTTSTSSPTGSSEPRPRLNRRNGRGPRANEEYDF